MMWVIVTLMIRQPPEAQNYVKFQRIINIYSLYQIGGKTMQKRKIRIAGLLFVLFMMALAVVITLDVSIPPVVMP